MHDSADWCGRLPADDARTAAAAWLWMHHRTPAATWIVGVAICSESEWVREKRRQHRSMLKSVVRRRHHLGRLLSTGRSYSCSAWKSISFTVADCYTGVPVSAAWTRVGDRRRARWLVSAAYQFAVVSQFTDQGHAHAPNCGPYFMGPTRVPKILWGQRCLLVKIRKTSQNKLVESMHNCMQKLTLKLYGKKIEQNTVIWPFISIMWVAPHIFFGTGPHC